MSERPKMELRHATWEASLCWSLWHRVSALSLWSPKTTVKNVLVITICVAIMIGVFYGVVSEKMIFKRLNH